MMAAHHLSKAHDAHVLDNHPTREHHLAFVQHHMDAATRKVEGGVKVDSNKIKQHWDDIRHHMHKLDRAMREDRGQRLIAPLSGAMNNLPTSEPEQTLDEATDEGTHVLFRSNFGRFHGMIKGRQLRPMTEPELTRHLVRDHGLDMNMAADMIGHFKSCNPLGEKLHDSTLSVDGALKHTQHALAQHLAGNQPMRDNHLKVAHVHMDAALDSLTKDDPGVVHHLPMKLQVIHNTVKAFK
jgi:hypothetical protein